MTVSELSIVDQVKNIFAVEYLTNQGFEPHGEETNIVHLTTTHHLSTLSDCTELITIYKTSFWDFCLRNVLVHI